MFGFIQIDAKALVPFRQRSPSYIVACFKITDLFAKKTGHRWDEPVLASG
jgi:hypothetical protein